MKKLLTLALAAAMMLLAAAPAAAAETTGGLIAITFDDGPSTKFTPTLLDGLAERRVKCTFFVMGNSLTDPHDTIIEANADVVRRAAAEGHQIASHSYSHPHLSQLSDAELRSELSKTTDALKRILGEGDYMLRPPYGDTSERVCAAAGAPVILWSMDPGWYAPKPYSAENLASYIVKNARDGDIILLHDFKGLDDVNAALTAIDKLREKGFEFVTVAELMRLRGITPADGEVFRSIPASAARGFDEADIENHWAYPELMKLRSLGIMQGDPDGSLAPERTLTRAECAALLWRAAGCPETDGGAQFTDCADGAWYASAVAWASERSLIEGYPDGSFRPSETLTREQLWVLAARAAGLSGESGDFALRYADDDRVSSWARGAIAALRGAGVLSRNDVELFRPQAGATRGEAAELVSLLIG